MHQVLLAPELGCWARAGRRPAGAPPPSRFCLSFSRCRLSDARAGGRLEKSVSFFSLSLSPPRSVRCARGGEELFTIAPLISNCSDVAVLFLTADSLFT